MFQLRRFLLMVSTMSGTPVMAAQNLPDNSCDMGSKIRGDGVSDLMVLGRPGTAKKVVVGKGLQTGRLANGQAATLGGIVMDIVMAVLGDVAGDCGRGSAGKLYPEPVREQAVGPDGLLDVAVCRVKLFWEVRKRWG